MMNFDKQTITMLAVAVCLFACFYLYKENQKQKTELSTFAMKVTSQLNRAPVREEKKKVTIVEEVEDKSED